MSKYPEEREKINGTDSASGLRIDSMIEADVAVEKVKLFYMQYIRDAASGAGGMRRLSAELGRDETAVQKILERNSLSALRRLAKDIEAMK